MLVITVVSGNVTTLADDDSPLIQAQVADDNAILQLDLSTGIDIEIKSNSAHLDLNLEDMSRSNVAESVATTLTYIGSPGAVWRLSIYRSSRKQSYQERKFRHVNLVFETDAASRMTRKKCRFDVTLDALDTLAELSSVTAIRSRCRVRVRQTIARVSSVEKVLRRERLPVMTPIVARVPTTSTDPYANCRS